VRSKPAIRGNAVVDRGRELVLGGQTVVDGDHHHVSVLREPRAQAVMCFQIALYPAAAVEVRHRRLQRTTGARGVDARGNLTRRAWDPNVLDARQLGRRLVHEGHHHAQLLAQLGQRREIAGHSNRLHELADDLRLGIHDAAAPTDAMTVEQL
jgi:hypothetical protein